MNPPLAFAEKNILVTGAGGYIGSALVKAIAASGPQSITLLDLSEQNIFELTRVLDAEFPAVRYQAVVGSVNDSTLMGSLFSESRKHLIFHCAAFKHVELMELNPFAALMNNAVGTFVLARTAVAHGCESLVLVSTDKAVRPHSIMGASKRLAELVTVSLSQPDAPMNAVRLCNISGSTGSVIPIFLEQIASGKALSITDPNATRCFLSLDEAVAAILDAAVCGVHGCILMPRFPPPVRIADLASSLVNGRGSYPFEIVGLRPGEKVSEEFIGPSETEIESTQGSLVVLETPKLTPDECEQLMQRLRTQIGYRNLAAVLDLLTSTVPEYVPSELMLSGRHWQWSGR
jgi:FlaA1/EpsC-like NDP-sugar epimerase